MIYLINDRWWQIPYYWVGCKMYDIFAGREALESSYFLTRSKALEAFPMLKKDELVGALVYYDGKKQASKHVLTGDLNKRIDLL